MRICPVHPLCLFLTWTWIAGKLHVTCTCTLITSLSFFSREIPHPVTLSWTMDDALIRWNTSVSVFAHIFLAEGPGSESCNFLDTRAGFASRMARFRHQVSVCVCVCVSD